MELEKIKKILKEHKQVIFGPYDKRTEENDLFLHYIKVDQEALTIEFTSDNQDYLMVKKLEPVMEMLYAEFGLGAFEVYFHIHPGTCHDKDIVIKLNDTPDRKESEMIPQIITFIQQKFFKPFDHWGFTAKPLKRT